MAGGVKREGVSGAVLLGGGRGQAQTRRCKVGPRRLATSQGMNKSD